MQQVLDFKMTLPDSPTLTHVFLHLLEDEKSHNMESIYQELIEYFELTEDDLEQMKKNGLQRIFQNRVQWVKYHLKKSGFLRVQKNNSMKITKLGLTALEENTQRISRSYIERNSKKHV